MDAQIVGQVEKELDKADGRPTMLLIIIVNNSSSADATVLKSRYLQH